MSSTPPADPGFDDFPQTPARDAVVAVVRAYGAVQRHMGPYFARFGLTPAQFQLLTIVNRLGDPCLTQGRLARELYVSVPNITVMLRRLESAGLTRRRGNPADRREKFVSLTERGRALLRRIWQEHQAQLERVVAGLNDAERAELARLLHKMIAGQAEPADHSAPPDGRAAGPR